MLVDTFSLKLLIICCCMTEVRFFFDADVEIPSGATEFPRKSKFMLTFCNGIHKKGQFFFFF